MKYDLLIKNGLIYDNQKNIIKKKDVAIKNGIIMKVANTINEETKETINATNSIILPGFINTHIHFGEYYLKGYNETLGTKEYIDYAEAFNNQNVSIKEKIRKSSSIICAYEALKYGETTLVGIRGWNAIEKLNIRLYMGYPLMNSKKLKEYLNNPFEKFETFKNNKLNTYYIFIHSLLKVDETILSKLSQYIKTNNIHIAIHLLETKEEEKKIKKKYHMSSIEVLEKYKLLSNKTLLIHCCYLSNHDIEIIKKYKCSISLNPISNLKLNNAIPNINKLKEINLCIGTDGVATGCNLNILDNIRILGLLYNIPDNELINMITINANKYLNNKLGKIQKDYQADLNIYNLNDYRIVRNETFINNLIYSNNIVPKYTIIGGKRIINNYKNILYNDKQISKKNISNKIKF